MIPEKRNGLRTWIEVDRKAVKHNYDLFRSLIPKRTKLMAVVKSNAYGHGLFDFSREMERLGADFLGVDSITEAIALRREGIVKPILILGYTMKEMLEAASAADAAVTVSSFETLRYIARFGPKFSKPLKIHIKVDTGMHRQGFLAPDIPRVLSLLRAKRFMSHVSVAGLYTHFASAKNPAFPADTKVQLAEFKKWVDAFRSAGFKPIVHAAATASALLFPESHFDMVRIGIGLYGLWPAKEIEAYFKNRLALKPALVWKTIISELKEVPHGSRIGYDLTETVLRHSKIAICPIGYWHGYPRSLSSIGRVLVKGRLAKVLGRVSMDMIAIDVTDISGLRLEDEVTLLGGTVGGAKDVSAETVAGFIDASWYEIITCLNPLIKRFFI